ncbi:MAG TPA: hypothetical protein PLR60_02260 [Syntrophorhabdaceae bacterium]|nr:hypothetical protein [Syntrophorhabdaceae bacterium]
MKEVRSYGAISWTMAALDSFDKMAECENPKGIPKVTPNLSIHGNGRSTAPHPSIM